MLSYRPQATPTVINRLEILEKNLIVIVSALFRRKFLVISNTNSKLSNLARALHDLFGALPAIRQHYGPDAVQKQLKLIAYFQRQHDQLASKLH